MFISIFLISSPYDDNIFRKSADIHWIEGSVECLKITFLILKVLQFHYSNGENRMGGSSFTLLVMSNYFQHRNTQETLAVLDRLDLDTDKPSEEEVAKRFGYEDDYYSGQSKPSSLSPLSLSSLLGSISWWMRVKPKIWSTFDEPYSSPHAKVEFFHKQGQNSWDRLVNQCI